MIDLSMTNLRRIALQNNCTGFAKIREKSKLIEYLQSCGVDVGSLNEVIPSDEDRVYKVNDICKKLKTTYNTNILKKADSTIIEGFKVASKMYANSGDGNATLMKLINNNFPNNMPIAKYISGPSMITVHKNIESNKTFYVFGENHDRKGECNVGTMITDYLESLFKTTNVFIDLYIEIPVDADMTFIPPGHMTFMSTRFKNCFDMAKRLKDITCDFVRIHNVDIRWRIDKENFSQVGLFFLEKVQLKLLNLVWVGDLTLIRNKEIFLSYDFREYSKRILLANKEDAYKYIMEQLNSSTHLKKELSRSTKSEEIYEWIGYNIRTILNRFHEMSQRITRTIYNILDKNHNNLVTEQDINYLGNFTTNITSIFMDGYTLSRIFKKFNVKDSNQPEEPHNIIIYTGNYHSNNYRDFLASNGYTRTTAYAIEGYRDCVDVKGIEQPLFS